MKAVDTFHNPQFKHNCAQAVAYCWKDCFAEQDIVERLAIMGGGRAPEGKCGALYAAQSACPEKAEEIGERFLKEIGAITCREIKGVGKVPCTRCVDVADQILCQLLKSKQL